MKIIKRKIKRNEINNKKNIMKRIKIKKQNINNQRKVRN